LCWLNIIELSKYFGRKWPSLWREIPDTERNFTIYMYERNI
jgi:hypothetical protein